MLRIGLQGGFGEKGRTSIAVATATTVLMFDAGIMVGGEGEDYYPRLAQPMAEVDALFISHAHEDHVGALSRLLSAGYAGPVFMTAETRAQADATLEHYADGEDYARHPLPADRIEIFGPGDTLRVGDLTVATGRSGHVVGGVWFSVTDGRQTVTYCADVVPESAVFQMDPLPSCDLLALDASYGADPVSGRVRAQEIAAWVRAHAGGCLLPTPLSGRSVELLSALDMPFAIHGSMRDAIAGQIGDAAALKPGIGGLLRRRLDAAEDWHQDLPLPQRPLLVDDGMGVAGPAKVAVPLADAAGYPILLTGHLPAGSPAALLHAQGRAAWIRMPTHPTAPENVALWESVGRPPALGHSCPSEELARLHLTIPALMANYRTGQTLTLDNGRMNADPDRE
jgi:phosphoribosyl 1,2-cyclic phosphodiesterase